MHQKKAVIEPNSSQNIRYCWGRINRLEHRKGLFLTVTPIYVPKKEEEIEENKHGGDRINMTLNRILIFIVI